VELNEVVLIKMAVDFSESPEHGLGMLQTKLEEAVLPK